MAEVELSEGLDTREDAVKIAHALWAEAVNRGWEGEYRDIVESVSHSDLIPVVGTASANLTVLKNLDDLGVAGNVLRPIVHGSGSTASVSFTHLMPTVGEGPGCACPEEVEGFDPRANIIAHAKEVLGEGNWQALRYAPLAEGAEKFTAECSSMECRNK